VIKDTWKDRQTDRQIHNDAEIAMKVDEQNGKTKKNSMS